MPQDFVGFLKFESAAVVDGWYQVKKLLIAILHPGLSFVSHVCLFSLHQLSSKTFQGSFEVLVDLQHLGKRCERFLRHCWWEFAQPYAIFGLYAEFVRQRPFFSLMSLLGTGFCFVTARQAVISLLCARRSTSDEAPESSTSSHLCRHLSLKQDHYVPLPGGLRPIKVSPCRRRPSIFFCEHVTLSMGESRTPIESGRRTGTSLRTNRAGSYERLRGFEGLTSIKRLMRINSVA